MARNFGQLQDDMATVIGSGRRPDDDIRTSFKSWINDAFRTIAYAFKWDEMRSEARIVTVAPYVTGTATFTNGSATVTGSGTTWTAAMVGRKMARGQGLPYYRVSAYVSATQLTLADAYAEDTAAGSAYTIFQDEYDVSATTHSIESAIIFRDVLLGNLRWMTQEEMDKSDYIASSTSLPTAICICSSTTVGTIRVRMLPCPDMVYRASIRGQRKWVDLAADTALYTAQGLPPDVEELAIDRALRWAPRIEGTRRVMDDDAWMKALSLTFANHRPRVHPIGRRAGFPVGAYGSVSRTTADMSGLPTS